MKKFTEIKYKKINLEKTQNELRALTKEFKDAESFKEQDAAFKKINKYIDNLQTNMTVGEVRYTIDTTNKTNIKNQEELDNISPLLSVEFNKFNKELVNAKFRKELEAKYGEHLFKMTETALEAFDEKIVPELQEQNKLCSEYSALLASAKIEFRGEVYNLSQLGKFTTSLDRDTRREASLAQAKFFEENSAKIGEIYDKLVHLRDTMAKKLGYKNFVELGYKRMTRTDYTAKEVAAYREQIFNDWVPFTQKLFAAQKKRVGIKNPEWYDYNVSFKTGNPLPKGTTEEKVAKAQEMYDELSEETSKFFHFMRDYELLDLDAKPGKAGGGYMTYLPKYKAPFIFSNFNGTSGDVDVLTHEFGHAFQGYESRNISVPDYRSPTMEACEIHSMSMELITYPWMDKFFGEEEDKYRYAHLEDAITFLPYGVTVDEFQHWVYENVDATHEERCAKWREIEKKYLPHKKYDEAPVFENGGWWMRQHHIVESPFYYIDYTLAQVVAFQFFIENEKNHEKAWKKYVKFCKLGGKYGFVELLAKGHLNNPFKDGSIKKLVKPLSKYLKGIDISKY